VPKLGLQSLQPPQPVDAIVVNPGRSSNEITFPGGVQNLSSMDASATNQDMISLSIDAMEQRLPTGAGVAASEQPRDSNIISLRFSLAVGDQNTVVEFDYNISKDTPIQVATEMVRELQLAEASIPMIADYLDAKVEEYIQGHPLVIPDQPRPRRSWTAQDQLQQPLRFASTSPCSSLPKKKRLLMFISYSYRLNSPRRAMPKSRIEEEMRAVDGHLAPPSVVPIAVDSIPPSEPVVKVKPPRRRRVGTIAVGERPGKLRERMASTVRYSVLTKCVLSPVLSDLAYFASSLTCRDEKRDLV
jgi:hypothetical protein